MTPAFNVLFLCTQQLGALDHGGGHPGQSSAVAASTPTRPAPNPPAEPMPDVIEQAPQLLGHDVTKLHSKSWNEFMRADAPRMDFVIALCDMLHGQQCPDFGDKAVTGCLAAARSRASSQAVEAERALLLNELYGSLQSPDRDLHQPALRHARSHGAQGAARRDRRRVVGHVRTEWLTMRVGINGMGRIGRLALRAALGGVLRAEDDPRADNRLDIVHVNELKGGAATAAHLLEFDSIHGRWRERIGRAG